MDEDYSAWVGRTETVTDVLDAVRSGALCAALGQEAGLALGAPLPLLHHWLYFWNVQPPASLGPDGHPAKGGFLPPIPLPRRMWAGGRLRFLQPLVIGEPVSRTSTISSITEKSGKSGPLVFVTVQHEISGRNGVAIIEEQDLVYREPASGRSDLPVGESAPAAAWHEELTPDTVLLFRYSALTMNGHRIHYDRPYAVEVEAYPALVVHGPLQATLLASLAAQRLPSPISGFTFRGQSPAFDGITLHICGNRTTSGAELWTEQAGIKNMIASVSCG